MKLTITCYTLFIIVISVDCGLVKDFFGNVREDVHNVVDKTVDIIGKGTHKITEGFGVYIHRNEGTKFPEHKSVISLNLTNQISTTEKIDKTDSNVSSKDKHKENTNHVQSTPAPEQTTISINKNVLGPHNISHNEYRTEANVNKNVAQPEVTSRKYDQTTESTTTISTPTTESVPWSNGVELENILPTIIHNDTHLTNNNTYAIKSEEHFTNELGAGEPNVLNKTIESAQSNKTAKCDEKNPKDSEIEDNNVHDLVSDQMFFKDNKPQPATVTNNSNACSEGLVRAANGDCLEPILIDVRKNNGPKIYNIFQADGCATGYARAEDASCQKIIG